MLCSCVFDCLEREITVIIDNKDNDDSDINNNLHTNNRNKNANCITWKLHCNIGNKVSIRLKNSLVKSLIIIWSNFCQPCKVAQLIGQEKFIKIYPLMLFIYRQNKY